MKFKAPRTLKLMRQKKIFGGLAIWKLKDQNDYEVQKGIVVYQKPYINENQFNQNYILKIKDSIGEKYLKGRKKSI